MKKFISISFCLMLCLTSLLFISGCKMKPKPVSEEKAVEVMQTAISNLETSSAIKMECEGLFEMVKSENVSYVNMFGMQNWTIKEGNYFYDYSISSFSFGGGEPETMYTKSLVIEEAEDELDTDSFLDEAFDGLADAQFVKATLLDDEYSIVFSVEDDGTTSEITYVIEDGWFEKVRVVEDGYPIEMEFDFNADAIEDIPQLPTNVTWDVYTPYIEVDGMPTEFVVGDTLDLTDVVIEYYEDDDAFFSDEYDVTMTMISGFDTTTAGTRTMTVTFYGLTFDIEYTVTEAVVE